jgi:hypothetical protein
MSERRCVKGRSLRTFRVEDEKKKEKKKHTKIKGKLDVVNLFILSKFRTVFLLEDVASCSKKFSRIIDYLSRTSKMERIPGRILKENLQTKKKPEKNNSVKKPERKTEK